MRINSINLYNFSSYEGNNFFDFNGVNSKKNIVLIGGKNGAGKTSLFTAIKIALYGPLAYGYVGPNPHYISKIKDLINSKAFQQDKVESEVRISISLKKERELKEYIITRKWDYSEKKLYEKYYVEYENELLEKEELSYFENYLKSIVPPDLFEFFLFDGEEVGSVFSTSTYNSYVKNAVFTLCGMDVFEIIRKYTKNYISKSSGDENDNLIKEYDAAKNEVEKLVVRKDNLEKEIQTVIENSESTELKIIELETSFKNAGGISKKERKNLDEKYKAAEMKKTEAATKIKMFVENLMPFIIANELTKDVGFQLAKEEKGEIYSYIQKNLSRDDFNQITDNSDTVDKILQLITDKFMPEGYAGSSEGVFDLSKDDAIKVKSIIAAVEEFSADEMVDLVNSKLNALQETEQINKLLKSAMSEEDMVQYVERENQLLKDKELNKAKLVRLQAELDSVNRDLDLQNSVKEKIKTSIRENAKDKHVYELSTGLSNMMKSFLDDRTVSIRSQLEELVVKNLKRIYRKNNLITHIEITSDFQFNLYQDELYDEKELLYLIKNLGDKEFISLIGNHGEKELLNHYKEKDINSVKNRIENSSGKEKIKLYKKIELSRLSKGERQIFILSLYWAIIMLSGQEIPFIIDTPYARIDANHRKEISEKFFPNISKQVIILSTDEEINEEYYKIIKPFIAKEYLLINDENHNKTTVEERYFFEVN